MKKHRHKIKLILVSIVTMLLVSLYACVASAAPTDQGTATLLNKATLKNPPAIGNGINLV
jgi:hypothetical protein